ncbi:MAG: response regulator [Acidobacteria bacterium]|nr:response regulator [Acidobacteriota bacterium]MBP8273065.1 response regulator [Acidobacteriota bacterium]
MLPPQSDEGALLTLALGRLRKLASQLPGVVYQFRLRPDGTSCFPYASDRIREIYRVTPAEVAEDASAVFAVLHPDDHAAVMASILASAESLQPWQHEYRVQFPNGDVRWLYGDAEPEREPDGSVLWHGFISDITTRKATEQARDELEAQLRQAQKVESIGRLAGGVAHDFNNLLTSVLGFATLAKGKLPPGSPASRDLDRVIESAERGAGLTQQLLAFARRRIVHPEVVNLHSVLGRIGPMIRRLLGEHIELVVDSSSRLGAVKIDVGSVEQLIMNLSLNARDAMPQGGTLTIRAETVTLSAAQARLFVDVAEGPHVRLVVDDTGSGMPADVQARVFEPFFTTKPVGQGTGLGLAVCHGIVQQAGGHILARSEEGRGTTFEIYLPVVEAALPVPPVRAVHAPPRGTETLLVVEDDSTILTLVSQVLARLGYRVLSASDGPSALEMYGAPDVPIDLLLTDVVMPRMSGRELALRLLERRPGLKVLYASGYTADAIVQHGVLDPQVEFIQKPYTPASLAARVRLVLDTPV